MKRLHPLAPWACTLALLLPLACERSTPAAEVPTDTRSKPEPADQAEQPEPQAPQLPEELAGSHVVVASGARFYPSADASEPVAMRSYLPEFEAGTLTAHHLGWVMRRGQVAGSRVELILVEGEEPGDNCGWGMEGLGNYELIWWVERESLLPVTTARSELRFEDGSALRLPAGTPILPAEGGDGGEGGEAGAAPRVSAWGFELALDALDPKDRPATALAFDPAPLAKAEADPDARLPEATLVLGGAPLGERMLYFLDDQDDDSSPVLGAREEAGRSFLTLRGRCVEVEARVDPDGSWGGLGFHGRGLRGGGYGGGPPPNFFAVPAGATIRWPDGRVAGHTRAPARVFEPAASGEGVCSYVSAGDGSRDLILCFAEDAIERLPLGHIRVEALRRKPKPEQPDRVKWSVEAFARSLRVPCLSHTLEKDPDFEARVQVKLRFDDEGKQQEAELNAVSGDPDHELLTCLREQLSQWRPTGQTDAKLEFEIVLAGRP